MGTVAAGCGRGRGRPACPPARRCRNHAASQRVSITAGDNQRYAGARDGAAIGRHVTDLVPIHIAATGGDTFLVVHRGPWYTHQEEGQWDGHDETVAKLAQVGQGVFRLHAASGEMDGTDSSAIYP